MSDPYWETGQIAADHDMHARFVACAQQEGIPDPDSWAWDRAWALAAQPGWGAAWASALASGNTAPGRDPSVVTDGQILSAVQALYTAG